MKYHVNPDTGDAGKCSATKGNCPFGGDEVHFTSSEGARIAYEKTMADGTFVAGPQMESFRDISEEVAGNITSLTKLALGKNQSKAIDVLLDARDGRVIRGGRAPRSAVDMVALLKKAKTAIGPKGNPHAYGELNKLINRLEGTKELMENPYYQGAKILKAAKLPKGAKRVYDKGWNTYSILLESGAKVTWNVESKLGNKPYFSRDYRGQRLVSLDIQDVLQGKGQSPKDFDRERLKELEDSAK